ncbi:hypothetical protein TNCT_169431 [Trichonephila clavata]|uniref:Uncharacterized protein n=1 Tax=Trichonephila clavata TaxID=2740835 RepID=A0A8X6ICT8_TRICU|nr:hypothetical protein TNCT_169431 [Trichonephila clavata]
MGASENDTNYGCMHERFAGQVPCTEFRFTCFSLDTHLKSHTHIRTKRERFKETLLRASKLLQLRNGTKVAAAG